MDGLIDKYLDILESTNNPAVVLSQFYCELQETYLDASIVKMIKRLTKLYGSKKVFSAIVSVYQMDIEDKTNPYGLLIHFLKKQVDQESKDESNIVDLTERANKIRKLLEEKDRKFGGVIE